MKSKNKPDTFATGVAIMGGIAIFALGALLYAVATSKPETKMIVNEKGDLKEVPISQD